MLFVWQVFVEYFCGIVKFSHTNCSNVYDLRGREKILARFNRFDWKFDSPTQIYQLQHVNIALIGILFDRSGRLIESSIV